MLGVVGDHVHTWVVSGRRSGTGPGRDARRPRTAMAAAAAGVAVFALALVPIVVYFADGLPWPPPGPAAAVVPHGRRHLPARQVLLVFPFAFRQSNMTWQAVDRMSFAMVGGGGPDSSRPGPARSGWARGTWPTSRWPADRRPSCPGRWTPCAAP